MKLNRIENNVLVMLARAKHPMQLHSATERLAKAGLIKSVGIVTLYTRDGFNPKSSFKPFKGARSVRYEGWRITAKGRKAVTSGARGRTPTAASAPSASRAATGASTSTVRPRRAFEPREPKPRRRREPEPVAVMHPGEVPPNLKPLL